MYQISTNSINFDWTHAIGNNLFDHIDYDVLQLLEQDNNNNDNDDEKGESNINSNKESIKEILNEEEKSAGKRSKASKIDTQWLILVNDKEFILDCVLTPGLFLYQITIKLQMNYNNIIN